jgi:hypothetical protein
LNRAARLVFSLRPRTSTTPYLIRLHWLPIKARIEFKLCLVTYKVLNSKQPLYLYNLLHSHSVDINMDLRSSDDTHLLSEPRARNGRVFNERNFAYSAPRLYNSLPLCLRRSETVDSFKKNLKQYLFVKAYDTERMVIRDSYKT